MTDQSLTLREYQDIYDRTRYIGDNPPFMLRGAQASIHTLGDDEVEKVWNPRIEVFRCVASTAEGFAEAECRVVLPAGPDIADGSRFEVYQEADIPVRIVAGEGADFQIAKPGDDLTDGPYTSITVRCVKHNADQPPRWRIAARTTGAGVSTLAALAADPEA